jgi:hypothetical protein
VRITTAAAAALLLSVVLLQGSGRSHAAVQAGQPSVNVAVVPGFVSPTYPGYFGIPKFPVTDPQLANFHFTAVPAANVTTAKLRQFDTVVLYGIRWSSLSATAQQAINSFAATGKVLIWDADDTGPQDFATFLHPFSDDASGEHKHSNGSVVSFPGGDNFLASSNPSSPYYLDPQQLVTDRNMINDMNAMKTGTPGWTPALEAANQSIPQGGWVVAWSYGVVSDHTGLAIYSGIDADAFADNLSPNYAITELKLQLGAPFLRTPDTSCASSCQPPPTTTGGKPYAACSFAKRVPRGWVHGRVPISLKASIAAGITGKVLTASGKTLASASESTLGVLRFPVQTRRLRSNRSAHLQAVVFVNGQQACARSFRLKVDNVRPRLLLLATSRDAGGDVLTLKISERSTITITGRGVKLHPRALAARRLTILRLPTRVARATLVVSDRAGNRLIRRLHWG